MKPASRWTVALAVIATATALCQSVLAGWQRGGTLPERLVWVALCTVLVVSAHLLPALVRGASPMVRGMAAVLWTACMASACYGHATFFLLAQQHAGEARANAVAASMPSASGRSVTVVMGERAAITRQLALARMQHCLRNCSSLEARRAVLAAKLDAVDAEADEIGRRQATDDRVTTQRDAQRTDPVTLRLAALLGTSVTRLDLLVGLMFAAVLEGMACLLWALALTGHGVTTSLVVSPVAMIPPVTPVAASVMESVTKQVTEPAEASHETMSAGLVVVRDSEMHPASRDASDAELTQLAAEIAAGRVRATVADIRRHLSCSQSRATQLRRRLREVTTSTHLHA